MKIKYILIFIISILAISANAATERDNYLCIYGANIESFVPANDENWYSITKGQTLSGVAIESSDGSACLNIKAGRDNHASNRQWVQNNMAAKGLYWSVQNMVGTLAGPNNSPDKLNFAIYGTLALKSSQGHFICQHVNIAQGHNGSKNDWWIFNNNHLKGKSLLCYDDIHDEFVYLYPSGLSSNYFTFTYEVQ